MPGEAEKEYHRAVEHHYGLGLGWVANWPVQNDVQIGMIGRLKAHSFSHDGGWLTDPSRRIQFSTDDHATSPDAAWSFTDSDDVTIDARLKGTTDAGWEWIGDAKAGIKFSFHREQAIVLTVGDSDEGHVADPNALRQQLLDAHDGPGEERMHLGETVITAVRQAQNGFLIVSSAGGGEVRATTEVTISPQNVDLAKVSGAINFGRERKTATVQPLRAFAVAFQAITLVQTGWRFLPSWLRPDRATTHWEDWLLDDTTETDEEWFVRFDS